MCYDYDNDYYDDDDDKDDDDDDNDDDDNGKVVFCLKTTCGGEFGGRHLLSATSTSQQ